MLLVSKVLLFTALISLLLMIAGLFKPWMILWWKDVQNRRKVVRLYGSVAFVSLLLYFIINITFGRK